MEEEFREEVETQDLGLGNSRIVPAEGMGMVWVGRKADQEWAPGTEAKSKKSSKRWGQASGEGPPKLKEVCILSVAAGTDFEHSPMKDGGQEGFKNL